MNDFETHPMGTAKRIAELEVENTALWDAHEDLQETVVKLEEFIDQVEADLTSLEYRTNSECLLALETLFLEYRILTPMREKDEC
jgi:hypothetical protein